MAERGERRPSPMRSLERALDVLAVLEQSRKPLRLSEIARQASLHVATTQRILGVLELHGYVAREPAGYTVGVVALANAHAYLMSSSLAQAAMPVLRDLAEATQLTASLSVRVGLSRVLIARVEGASPLRYQLPVGERLPLHVGAGRVIAATLSSDEVDQLLAMVGPIHLASGQSVSPEQFRRDLETVRQQGYAVSSNERVAGAASVAAPVLDANGDLVAMLQIAGLAEDVRIESPERYVAELKLAGDAIARRLT